MPAPTTSILLNSTDPAPPAGNQNVKPQSDGGTPLQSISLYPQPATASLLGVVKPDGTTITISGGVLTAAPQPGAATIAGVQQESYVYAADTGAANAYAVALSPAPTLVAGSLVVVKIANPNTGASTLAVNGGAAIAIKKNGATPLAGGEFAAGQIVELVYDGASFQWQGGAGSATYFGQGYATAAAGNNQVALGSVPLAGSLSIFVAGAILTPSGYAVSGAVVTLYTALTAGQIVVANWATANASPGGITLSTYLPYAVLRGTAMTQGAGPSLSLGLPPTAVAGDLIVAFAATEDNSATLSGSTWTLQNNTNPGAYIAGFTWSKTLASADISAGAVTLTVLSQDNPVLALAVFVGASTNGLRETDAEGYGGAFTSPVSGPSTSAGVLSSDTALYFGANRSQGTSSTDTCSRGALQQSESPAARFCGCLYLEQVGTAGSITPSFSYSYPGAGYYQAIVIVEG